MPEEIITEITEEKILSEYKIDYSFSYKESNIFSILLFISCFLFFVGLFGIIWGFEHTWIIAEKFVFNVYITIPVLITGIFLHEFLHAVTLLVFSETKIKHLKAGINWINFTPYIHCKHAVSVKVYRISTIAPALLMGIIPVTISIIVNNVIFLFFGILFIVTSGSDILSLWKIRKIKNDYLASDHAERAGCEVFENPFLKI